MPHAPLAFASASGLLTGFRARRISPEEAVQDLLARIARHNPRLNAFLAVYEEASRAAARRATRRPGAAGALHGVPVSIKDLILTTDGVTTAGSRIFGAGLVAEQDATLVRRLRRAGAIVIGKTNLHEVALGVTSANEHFGPVRNPWDTARVAGGSSGGAAAAVAAGLGPLAVGTDTRGSIRIPAAACGITGLKPTRGLVPLDGVLPLSQTLDHAGPMARTATDCALMLGVMAGGADAGRYLRAARRPVRGLKVGVSEFHLRDCDAEVARAIDDGLRVLRRIGCRVRTVKIPALEASTTASVVISASEAVTIHDANLRARPEDYGPMVRQRLEGGYQWKAIDYVRALRERDAIAAAFEEAFGAVDLLVGAALAVPATPIGELTVRIGGTETTVVEAFTRGNAPQNMAGIPSLALPCGFSSGGLPLGWQFMAARDRDATTLALARAFQAETDWHVRVPPGC